MGKPEVFSVNGIFCGHPKGFGFVTVEGMEQDVFIPEDRTGAALHGDRVQIVVESQDRGGGRRAEGSVLKVLEHANKEVVGYYQKSKGFGFVIPDNQKISKDIFIPQAAIWVLSPGIRWWRGLRSLETRTISRRV